MSERSEHVLYPESEEERFVVYATHSCFDDAMEYCDKAVRELPELLDKLIVVHGIALHPEGPRKDRPFAHAWVEHAGMCWNSGLVNGEKIWYGVARSEYYVTMRVQETATYDLRKAYRLHQVHHSSGPWVPRYSELLRDEKLGLRLDR